MPITEVSYQPNTDSLNSAYRPIVFRCKAKIPGATSTNYICPVVFCDIYIDGIYYKSLARTQFIKNVGQNPEYEFDIQDGLQEVMGYNLPNMDGTLIKEFSNTIKKVFVKFRSTYTDTNGFIKSEQTEPIQGTSSSSPVAGGGTLSNEIYVLNTVVQHEENQLLNELLNSYKTGTWSETAFPLTKKPKRFNLCKNDSSHFPIVSNLKPKTICIKAKTKTGEIIDLCSEIIEDCPVLENIQYSIVKDIPNNVQIINFTWTNPSNILPVPYEIKIYRRLHGTTGPWTTLQFTVYPNPVTSQSVITPFGYYDFVFEVIGRCNAISFSDLPYLDNVGVEKYSPPTILIRWKDNQGNEERICAQNSCSAIIEVVASDPDGDITNIKILKSTDGAVTWNVLIADFTGNFFTDTLDSVSSNKYKAVVTDSAGFVVESNILTYKGNSAVRIERSPDVYITIYKADSGSHYIGQLKFYNLQASTVDSSNIVKVELHVRFRAIGENIWWEKTETHIVSPASSSISLNRQFVYGFKDPSKYIGTRDWNGADNVFVELKIYTSSGEMKTVNPASVSMPWLGDYPDSITM